MSAPCFLSALLCSVQRNTADRAGGPFMVELLLFVIMTEPTCSPHPVSLTRTSHPWVTHRRSVDCQVLGRLACVKGCDKPQRFAPTTGPG